MKVNTDAPSADEILTEMRKTVTGQGELPRRVTGPPESDTERVEAASKLADILQLEDAVRVVCIGCGDTPSIKQATPCVCGGWVCEACRAMETEGECDHEPPVLPEGAHDDE